MRRRLSTWLQLQVIVAMTTVRVGSHSDHDHDTVPSAISVGLLQPLEGPLGFERTGSAATMAIHDAQRQGYLNQTHVE